MKKQLICIVCPRGCQMEVDIENDYQVTGNFCPRGAKYAIDEIKNPARVITSTVEVEAGNQRRCPVKTREPIPKHLMLLAMAEIQKTKVQAPIKSGDVIIQNLCDTGIDLIACRDVDIASN